MTWLFIVSYKLGNWRSEKRLYILIKHSGYYRSLGFNIPREDRKLISYNTLKSYFNLGNLFHISQMPIDKVVERRDKKNFMFANKILMSGSEDIIFYKKLHLNINKQRLINRNAKYLIDEFTKDIRDEKLLLWNYKIMRLYY